MNTWHYRANISETKPLRTRIDENGYRSLRQDNEVGVPGAVVVGFVREF